MHSCIVCGAGDPGGNTSFVVARDGTPTGAWLCQYHASMSEEQLTEELAARPSIWHGIGYAIGLIGLTLVSLAALPRRSIERARRAMR